MKSLIGASRFSCPRRRLVLAALNTGLLLPISARSAGRAAPAIVTIAAASDLKFVLEEISSQVLTDAGVEIRLVFGSSGNLSRQIQQGAPFDLFMSADEQLIDQLHQNGHTVNAGVHYATGRLVLIAGPANPGDFAADLPSLISAAPRIAIANPDHAPYGRAGLQALIASGFADGLRHKWVVGDSVMQATQYVLTGAAPFGFSAASLALAPPLKDKLKVRLVPAELYAPLRQRMALTRRSNASAATVMKLLQSPEAARLFLRFGFSLPETQK